MPLSSPYRTASVRDEGVGVDIMGPTRRETPGPPRRDETRDAWTSAPYSDVPAKLGRPSVDSLEGNCYRMLQDVTVCYRSSFDLSLAGLVIRDVQG